MNMKKLLMNKVPWLLAALGMILIMFVTINTLFESASEWVQKPVSIQVVETTLMSRIQPSEGKEGEKEKPVALKAGMDSLAMSVVAAMTKEDETMSAALGMIADPAEEAAEEIAEEIAKEDGPSPSPQYHQKHIVVKFTPEAEKEIASGANSFPGKPKRMISKRNLWRVEVGKGESVEQLLDKYTTEYSGMVQYAQLDYQCEIQKANGKNRKKGLANKLDEVNNPDQKEIESIAKENEKLSKKNMKQIKKEMKKGNNQLTRNNLMRLNSEISRQKRGMNRYGNIAGLINTMVSDDIISDDIISEFLYSSLADYLDMDIFECSIADDSTGAGTTYFAEGVYPFESLNDNPYLQYLYDINIQDAWNQTEGENSVVIALVDTGIAYEDASLEAHEHERLSSDTTGFKKAPGLQNLNLWVNELEISDNSADDDADGYVDNVNGFDFVDYDPYPHDDNGHGTYLANIIAHNEQDALGVANNCTLMPVKVLDYQGKGYASVVAEGIYYAVDHGADIINLSLAWLPGLDPGPILHDAIIYAAEAGVIMIAGSGNNASKYVCYPAAYPETIAVGATQFDPNHTRAYYSNYGKELEIMAPGGNNALDLDNDGYPDGILQETFMPKHLLSSSGEVLANPSKFGYAFLQGTSISTAIVSGVVGLILSQDPNMSLAEVRNLLYSTATKIGKENEFDKEYGYGLINAGAAITQICAQNGNCVVEPPAEEPPVDEVPAEEVPPTEEPPAEEPPVYYWDNPSQCADCLAYDELETECDLCLDDEEVEDDCAPPDEAEQPELPPDCLDDPELETECDPCLFDEDIEEECN